MLALRPTTFRSALLPAATAMRRDALELLDHVAHTDASYSDVDALVDRMMRVSNDLRSVEAMLSA